MTYVVTSIALDGSLSVNGSFGSEYEATLWANGHETVESGLTCDVHELEAP